ncbi:hypothetical protein ACT29H_11280 [Thermophagus sp. OGC60D27]|uniref:hypothetical protein n=1 Tax=Thermophagus sp. OGC60D27 TaxID=3458415 RepID=UPI004037AAE6
MVNKKSNNEDRMLKQLFQESFEPEEIPTADFNKKVMARILNEWVSRSNYFDPLVNTRNRWWIVPGIFVLFIIGFLLDLGQLSQNATEFAWLKNISGTFQFLYSWIKPIHLMIIGALLAVSLLLGLDHLFKKLSNI